MLNKDSSISSGGLLESSRMPQPFQHFHVLLEHYSTQNYVELTRQFEVDV